MEIDDAAIGELGRAQLHELGQARRVRVRRLTW
jgi:hypothetical protein